MAGYPSTGSFPVGRPTNTSRLYAQAKAPSASDATADLPIPRPLSGESPNASGFSGSISVLRSAIGTAAQSSEANAVATPTLGVSVGAEASSGATASLVADWSISGAAPNASELEGSATGTKLVQGSAPNASGAGGSIGIGDPYLVPAVGTFPVGTEGVPSTASVGFTISGSAGNSSGATASLSNSPNLLSGSTAPTASGLQGFIGDPNFNRWKFIDPVSNDIYYFTVNPSTSPTTAGAAGRLKSIAYMNLTNSDNKTLVFKKSGQSRQVRITGSITTAEQLYQLETWAKKRYPVKLRDDLQRELEVYVESFEPRREHKVNMPYYHTYTLTYAVV